MKVAPAKHALTYNGIIAETEKGIIVGAIFQFFIMNSNTVLIGYPILDPNLKEERSEVLDKLYEVAEITASYTGYSISQTFSNLDFVQERLENNGWVLGDSNVKNYLKSI